MSALQKLRDQLNQPFRSQSMGLPRAARRHINQTPGRLQLQMRLKLVLNHLNQKRHKLIINKNLNRRLFLAQ